jgi:hypothetical protein
MIVFAVDKYITIICNLQWATNQFFENMDESGQKKEAVHLAPPQP